MSQQLERPGQFLLCSLRALFSHSIVFRYFFALITEEVFLINLPIPVHFSSLIPNMSMFTLAIFLFDHFQFTLIRGPNIPGS